MQLDHEKSPGNRGRGWINKTRKWTPRLRFISATTLVLATLTWMLHTLEHKEHPTHETFAALVIGAGLLFAIGLSTVINHQIDKLIEYARVVRSGERLPAPHSGFPEFRRLGEALEEMRLSFEAQNSLEDYVQILTHEIKSPLTAIRGAAELCQNDLSDDHRRRFLNNIRTEAERIQNLVETLLDISALESRKGAMDMSALELNSIVEEVVISLEPIFVKKNLRLDYLPSDEDLCFRGENFLITQSVRNLIQNAIDFSPEGGKIEIKTQRGPDGVVLSILDEGPGIPDYALPRIFEKFYSLGRPHSGKKSSGLGLSFVNEVAVLHRGRVEVKNRSTKPGGTKGTSAVLHLPF